MLPKLGQEVERETRISSEEWGSVLTKNIWQALIDTKAVQHLED